MVSNCGKNEYGTISGGSAGDQTGKEYWAIAWYNFGQTVIYRHPNRTVGNLIADLAQKAADNDNIGYDQPTRLSFYRQLQNTGWQVDKITTPCAADCSSATAGILLAAGHILSGNEDKVLKAIGEKIVDNIDPADTTYDIGEDLANAGFKALRDSKYLTSDKYLLPGDINLNATSHVNINLTTGANARTSEQDMVIINPVVAEENAETTAADTEHTAVKDNYWHLQYGAGLNNPLDRVEAVQHLLREHGYVIKADGEYGRITEAAVKNFQADRGLDISGIVDAAVWTELIIVRE